MRGRELRFGLAAGDLAVLFSDGALADGPEWAAQQLGLCAAAGIACSRVPARKRELQGRDGYISAALVWVVLCVFGAAPYKFSDAIPRYLDALFEAASGLTTTGAPC